MIVVILIRYSRRLWRITGFLIEASRDNLEIKRTFLCIIEEMTNEFDRVEWDELDRARAYLRNDGGQPARIRFVHDHTVDADEKRTTQDAAKVLWISNLVEEKVELALGRLFLVDFDKILHGADVSVAEFATLEYDVLMLSTTAELGQLDPVHVLGLNACLFGELGDCLDARA